MKTNTELDAAQQAELESLLQTFSQARQALQRPNRRIGSDSRSLGSRLLIKPNDANIDFCSHAEQPSRIEETLRSSTSFAAQLDRSVQPHIPTSRAERGTLGTVLTDDRHTSDDHRAHDPDEHRVREKKGTYPEEETQERRQRAAASDRLAAWERELAEREEALAAADDARRDQEVRCADAAADIQHARAGLADAQRKVSRREEECARRERACAEREAAAARQLMAAPARVGVGGHSLGLEEVQLLVQERGRRAEVEDRAERAEARLARANDR
jgi:hypothetical protein